LSCNKERPVQSRELKLAIGFSRQYLDFELERKKNDSPALRPDTISS
jgi:hypothetical protein